MKYLLPVLLLLSACAAVDKPRDAANAAGLPPANVNASPSVLATVPSPAVTSASAPAALPRGEATLAGRTIAVDIADTAETRRQGLSGRPSLAPETGLILAWDEPETVSIWMPKMNFPIDVIFARNGLVDMVYRDRQPCREGGPCPTFGPEYPVDFVLEVPAGSAKTWDLKLGTSISFRKTGP